MTENQITDLKKQVAKLKENFNLTDFEALQIAVKWELNENLSFALISDEGEPYLSALNSSIEDSLPILTDLLADYVRKTKEEANDDFLNF